MLRFLFVSLFWLACVTSTAAAQKAPAPTPPEVWVINSQALTPQEQMLTATLQGLVNRQKPRVWMKADGMSGLILEQMRQAGTRIYQVDSPWALLKTFRGQVRGIVLCKMGSSSVSIATSLSGVLNSVAVDESLQAQATEAGLKVLVDARTMSQQEALEKYKSKFRRGVIFEQRVEKPGHLRDYAVSLGAFLFSTEDSNFRIQVAKEFGPEVRAYGWSGDEYGWVRDISMANGTVVASDWSVNLSFLSKLPAGTLKLPSRPHLKTEDNVRYIAFVISDGDNIQWVGGGFPTATGFWANPHRGEFPVSWEMCQLLTETAPRALEYYYQTAKKNDDFVTGPGLPGYTFPHFQTDREALAKQSVSALRASGMRVASVLNANEGDMSEVIPLLNLPEIDGVIYKDYSPYNRRKGALLWHNGKPCISYRFLLWEGLQSGEEVAREVAKLPDSPRTDPNSYALVNVHAWSYGNSGGPMEAIRRAIAQLPPGTRVVTATDLISLLRDNFGKLNGTKLNANAPPTNLYSSDKHHAH